MNDSSVCNFVILRHSLEFKHVMSQLFQHDYNIVIPYQIFFRETVN